MVLLCVPSLDKDGLKGNLSQHLGKTPYFVLIKWEDEQIENFQVIEVNQTFGRGHDSRGIHCWFWC
jgi:predicted Fe-Mo cluster-binding NifX family protein